jgi:thioredoxin reductase
MSNDYEVAVIGGGAAGLSAALVLARARRRVAVIDAAQPRNAPAAHMQGYLSRDGLPPRELVELGRGEVRSYGVEIIEGIAVEITPSSDKSFQIRLDDGRQLSARRILVTTGLHDELPDVEGLRDRWARDVLHCPYCHGYEVRDQPLGVLGGPPDAVRYAHIVRQWTDDVVFFVPPDTLTAEEREGLVARAIGIVEGTVTRILVEADQLSGVALADGRTVPRQALFVPPRFVPNSNLLADLGCDVDENGWPTKDSLGLTTVPGVWVAGNVANPRAQVVTAAGEGSAAAMAINADLVDEDVRSALADSRAGRTA